MIVKKVAAKKGTGSFGGLADYIMDKSNDGAKIENVSFSNCPYTDQEKNLSYIKAMQNLNQRTNSDKTLHLIVSFQEDEKPTIEQLKNIEEELLKSIGMKDHHRLSVSHTNSNNFHIHIAINRIHPINNNVIDPYRDIPKLHKKAVELEEKHKLQIDNHTPNWQLEKESPRGEENTTPAPAKNNKIKDIEIHSGMDSLLTWIKEEALEDIKAVLKDPNSTLEDLHKTLADYNLELKLRGNGIVIADKTRNLFVKASDVHRDLSKGKLTKRYGEFKTSKIDTTPKKNFAKPVNKYWQQYQEQSKEKKASKTEDLRLEKLARATLKEAIIKKYAERILKVQLNPLINKKDKAKARKEIYSQRSKELKALQDTFATKRKDIYSKTKQTSYKEHLMELALQGDEGALKELRKQKQEIKPDDKVLMHPEKKKSNSIFKTMISKITKQGNAVYEIGKNSKIIDKGDHLKISIDKSEADMVKALNMAIAKYGNTLDIQGSLEFKKRVLMVTQKYDLKINFTDNMMAQINKASKEKEKQDLFKVSLRKHITSMIKIEVDKLGAGKNEKRIKTKIKKLCFLYGKTKTNAPLFEGDLNTLNIGKNITSNLEKVDVNIAVDSFVNNEENRVGLKAMNVKVEEALKKEIQDAKTPKEAQVKKGLSERFEKFKWVLENKESITDITVSYYRNRGVDIDDMVKTHNLEIVKLDKKVPAIDYSESNIEKLKQELTSVDEIKELELYLSGEKNSSKFSKIEGLQKIYIKAAEQNTKREKNQHQKQNINQSKKGMKR